ncbi:MAG: phosphatase PAP2 family protein [Terracidiphilus sp.]
MGKDSGALWSNRFDVQIELFLNHAVGRHLRFEQAVVVCHGIALFNSVVIVSIIWFLLFDRNRPNRLGKDFDLLLGSAFFSLFATLAARGLALSLPFRARPIADTSIQFRVPADIYLPVMKWSAFPSDHATLFFGLAAGIFLVSRRMGWLAIGWVSLVICLPLMYMGIHWPSDILAGAVLGVSCTQFARIPAIRAYIRQSVPLWHQNHPQVFYAVLFVWSYETASLFDDVRHLLKLVSHSI